LGFPLIVMKVIGYDRQRDDGYEQAESDAGGGDVSDPHEIKDRAKSQQPLLASSPAGESGSS